MKPYHWRYSVLVDLLATLSIFALTSTTASYKHVIFMHGIITGESEVTDFLKFVEKVHPGTNVTFINDFVHASSLRPLWIQVANISKRVESIMREHPDGVHLVCFSQGGLICRGLLETMPNHNVINFISLSSPQAGQYGDTDLLSYIFPNYVKHNIYKLFYTARGQALLSIANYWNDPHHQKLYRKWSSYLAVINNETLSNQTITTDFRASFTRIKNLILIGGQDDGIITPWQSSQFGSYDNSEGIISYTEQKYYKEDSFGLKTLDRRGSLHMYTVAGVKHTHWHKNFTVFQNCMEPWLT